MLPSFLKILACITGQNVILPYYQYISDEELPHQIFYNKNKKVASFKKDLDQMLKVYKPIGIEEISDNIYKNQRSFHLSFDGGFSEHYTLIAPILKELGVPATFFVNTAFVGNKEMMFENKASLLLYHLRKKKQNMADLARLGIILSCKPELQEIEKRISAVNYSKKELLDKVSYVLNVDFKEYLEQQKPYLTIEQVKKLSDFGFTIGSHSVDHPFYAELSLKDQLTQTKESLQIIHSWINQKIKLFSFPFGDNGVKLKFFKEIQNEVCPPIKLTFGTEGLKNDTIPWHFHRIKMEKGHSLNASYVLLNHYFRFALKAPFFKNRIVRS